MSDPNKRNRMQPDKNLAAEQRPVPSQAEGDLETVEEDLEEKEHESASKKRPASKHPKK